MSAPRTKRQFAGAASDPAQRQITSFFTTSTSTPSSYTSLNNASTASPRGITTAEASIQSNLLSVGMRVRKAVPEGYKTGSYSAFALWDESSNATMPTEAGPPRATAFSTPKELLPFCGIHKVGGLDTQGSSTSNSEPTASTYPSFLNISYANNMDDVPGLTLSQESTNSNDSTSSGITGARTRKRFFAEDEDEPSETLGGPFIPSWQDGEVSPRSLAPVGWGNSRVLAVPRKGTLRGKLRGTCVSEALGQENAMAVDEDFEEAPFLDRGFEAEMEDF
ncbi:ribonucleotide reductase inhibitor-domain-containing protein [Xylariales sp. AK1849]|nr:ribonucleotide reductase inhibitor-domain-containing protein [Xylariales sp. AK1849]